jgi:heavy metal efflux system protein
MLCTLFLTRYLMPVLYSFFPAPAGHSHCDSELILGSHYTDRFLRPSAATKHALEEAEHQHGHGGTAHDDTPTPGASEFGGSQS